MNKDSPEFIKVSQGDASKQTVDVRGVKPINNIKVIRQEESFSSISSSSGSETSESSEEAPRKKKTKKVLRKKEPPPRGGPPPRHDFSMFSNPKKVSQQQNNDYDDDESEYTEDSSDAGYSEQGSEDSEVQQTNSFEEKQKLKQDLLIKMAALEKKGFEFSKKFNMTSNYEEMEFEYTKIKKFIESQAGIKFARRCLMACVTGIEFLNKKFDPFNIKLEGWSENVMENVDDYDSIFEKLHEKYSSKAEVAPEVELLLMLGGSAFMFHLTNSLLKGPAMSNLVAQNNPNFMASMMGAMSQGMKEMSRPPGPQAMPQPGSQPNFPPPMETRGLRKEMRGPTLDQNLFNGTPLASNYPQPPMPPNFSMNGGQQRGGPPQNYNAPQGGYYEENPINDDDRFSIASSDSSDVSSVSLGSTVKRVNIKKGGGKKGNSGGGFELNIK
jgi:hypothetical protein